MGNHLLELLFNGNVTVEELANVEQIIRDAKLICDGVKACRKNISFPFNETRILVYSYESCGEYYADGYLNLEGQLEFCSNWGGNHIIGSVNINKYDELLIALQKVDPYDGDTLEVHLRNFFEEQIEKASGKN